MSYKLAYRSTNLETEDAYFFAGNIYVFRVFLVDCQQVVMQ
jgi:hypothetical protein